MVKLFLHLGKEQGSIHQIIYLRVEFEANLGFAIFLLIFDKFEKGIFWVCDREIVGFVYKGICCL